VFPFCDVFAVVMLYGYLREKDVFETKYQLYFARRLLNSSGVELVERSFITKLKVFSFQYRPISFNLPVNINFLLCFFNNSKHFAFSVTLNQVECGYIWTGKLEKMLTDVQLSKEIVSDFLQRDLVF
jgi:hypothetical protein